MYIPAQYPIDVTELLEETRVRYDELRLEMGLDEANASSHCVIRNMVTFALEDAINKTTSGKVRPAPNMLFNYVSTLLDGEIDGLTGNDKEDIETILVEPLLEQASIDVDHITSAYDKFFSLWEIVTTDVITAYRVKYLGDFRIEQWHEINSVPKPSQVNVVRYVFSLSELNRDVVLKYTEGDIVWTQDVVDKALQYLSSGCQTELFTELVRVMRQFTSNTKAHKLEATQAAKDVVGWFRKHRKYDKMMSKIEASERVFADIVRNKIYIDVLMPSIGGDSDRRKEIVGEIEEMGCVIGDVNLRVGVTYG